jgi:hypothetical protein
MPRRAGLCVKQALTVTLGEYFLPASFALCVFCLVPLPLLFYPPLVALAVERHQGFYRLVIDDEFALQGFYRLVIDDEFALQGFYRLVIDDEFALHGRFLIRCRTGKRPGIATARRKGNVD